MNISHEKQEGRYWAHGIIADLVLEYLKSGQVKELIPVIGNGQYGRMRYDAIKAELEHFAAFHDVRRVTRPRTATKVRAKHIYSGKKTGTNLRRVK